MMHSGVKWSTRFNVYYTLQRVDLWSQLEGKAMNLFCVEGTVSAIGQFQFDNSLTVYAYIQITEKSGRRVTIDQIAVANDVSAILQLGCAGEFFIDRIYHASNNFRCQLWGVRTASEAVLDSNNIRLKIAFAQIWLGVMLTPVLGLGLVFVAMGLVQLAESGSEKRRRMFYGEGSAELQSRPASVRI